MVNGEVRLVHVPVHFLLLTVILGVLSGGYSQSVLLRGVRV